MRTESHRIIVYKNDINTAGEPSRFWEGSPADFCEAQLIYLK